jgi:hypothetical protein
VLSSFLALHKFDAALREDHAGLVQRLKHGLNTRSLSLAHPIKLTAGSRLHLVTLMDAAILISG